MRSDAVSSLSPDIIAYYEQGKEAARTFTVSAGSSSRGDAGTCPALAALAARLLLDDVGGGPGLYACWLAGLGYEVHLVDATPLHVEQARQCFNPAAR